MENKPSLNRLHTSPNGFFLSPWLFGTKQTSGNTVLTRSAVPIDLLLSVGLLANVDMDGKSVPPKAISTSFGGCLKLHRKHRKSLRSRPGGASAVSCIPKRNVSQSAVVCRKFHLIR